MKTARFVLPLFVTAIGVLSMSADVSNRTLDDWPQWRGKNRDGIATETGLLKTWPPAGPPLAWKAAGAEILQELKDEHYGSRGYMARDPEGNEWYFGTYRPGGHWTE